jgi:hypothetical protein
MSLARWRDATADDLEHRCCLTSALPTRFNRSGVHFAAGSLAPRTASLPPQCAAPRSSPSFLFAVFACCWVIRTGNVWGVMGWHSGWNWLLAVGFEWRVTALDAHVPALLAKVIPSGSGLLNGGIEGPEGGIVCTLALTCGIAYHFSREWLSRHQPKDSRDIESDDAANR